MFLSPKKRFVEQQFFHDENGDVEQDLDSRVIFSNGLKDAHPQRICRSIGGSDAGTPREKWMVVKKILSSQRFVSFFWRGLLFSGEKLGGCFFREGMV